MHGDLHFDGVAGTGIGLEADGRAGIRAVDGRRSVAQDGCREPEDGRDAARNGLGELGFIQAEIGRATKLYG